MQMFAGLDASAAPHRSDRSEFDAQAWIAFRDRVYRSRWSTRRYNEMGICQKDSGIGHWPKVALEAVKQALD
jgi:hypothetical protein